MTNRLTRRRKLVIGGCIFAALVLGAACTGIVHAGSVQVSISATGDGPFLGTSEWTWAASDGDLTTIPPAGTGQEIIRGGYSGSLLLSGPGSIATEKSLSSGDISAFSTGQQVNTAAPGILTESISVDSCGSPAGGVSCGSAAVDPEGANLTRSAYCEHAGMRVLLLTDKLHYRSAGTISQGAIEVPDSMVMEITGKGIGSGTITVTAVSASGIGTGNEAGYIHRIYEEMMAGGNFSINGNTRWSSFTPYI
jgi:hypothetical protein